jgi:hypothetical protein
MKEESYTSTPCMGLRPVQSLSAYTRVHFTFTLQSPYCCVAEDRTSLYFETGRRRGLLLPLLQHVTLLTSSFGCLDRPGLRRGLAKAHKHTRNPAFLKMTFFFVSGMKKKLRYTSSVPRPEVEMGCGSDKTKHGFYLSYRTFFCTRYLQWLRAVQFSPNAFFPFVCSK